MPIRPVRSPAVLGLAIILVSSASFVTSGQDASVMRSGSLQITYEAYYGVRTNGNNSTYGQGLTHRYVDGELRFLTHGLGRGLHEFRLPAPGTTQTELTARFDMAPDVTNDFNGIWFEQAKNRLWLTSAQDYTVTNFPAKVSLLQLNADGTMSLLKQFFLNVPAKRVYGGCNAVPPALVEQLGGSYVCGWGGYTSLVMQGGNASIGPTMYAIPDPDTIKDGARVRARTVLDAADAQSNRGVRKTIPQNYFDGGDRRQNPPSRPETPPDRSARWLSPNRDGLGWMVWGDSYYNTGFWIGTTYGAVASLCKGACWYQSSTLAFDGRQFELHLWDGASLGRNRLARPTAMFELDLPRGNSRVWSGNIPTGNIAGATYDPVSGRLYMIGFPFDTDDYTGRLYAFRVSGN
ncbi:MAG: hypothetical protein IT183_09160 [Acidobacteria bacterium]|nr:hypothetical protein [Acidobacteriota bacterium]